MIYQYTVETACNDHSYSDQLLIWIKKLGTHFISMSSGTNKKSGNGQREKDTESEKCQKRIEGQGGG